MTRLVRPGHVFFPPSSLEVDKKGETGGGGSIGSDGKQTQGPSQAVKLLLRHWVRHTTSKLSREQLLQYIQYFLWVKSNMRNDWDYISRRRRPPPMVCQYNRRHVQTVRYLRKEQREQQMSVSAAVTTT